MSEKDDEIRAVAEKTAERAAKEDEGRARPKKDEGGLPPELVLALSWQGDEGMARLMAQLCDGRVCFDCADRTYYLWQGHHWAIDDRDQAPNVALDAAREALRSASYHYAKLPGEEAEDNKKHLADRAKSLNYKRNQESALKIFQRQPEVAVSGRDTWDQHTMLLAVANGVINLANGELEKGDPRDFIRTAAKVAYDPAAECPVWDAFVAAVFGDPELVDYWYKIVGYSLGGVTLFNHVYILYGRHGRNGKTTLLETTREVLGDLASPIPSEYLLEQKMGRNPDGPSAVLYDIMGKALVWGSETDENKRFSASNVKWLSGGDTVTCRPPNARRQVKYIPRHVLLLLTNNKPKISANEDAFWERARVVEFPHSFVECPDPNKPWEQEQDPGIKQKLRAELPGILRRYVEGSLLWQADGHLNMPAQVRTWTNNYRDDEDVIGRFVAEACEIHEDTKLKAGDLYQVFQSWAVDSGEQAAKSVWKREMFGRQMTGYVARTAGLSKLAKGDPGYSGTPYYLGLRVKEDWWDKAFPPERS